MFNGDQNTIAHVIKNNGILLAHVRFTTIIVITKNLYIVNKSKVPP